ncbi:MAG: hypothetical protein JWR10_2448 [Rubritepida sp.]|nr:hypothetical protein [Rubritepida sp.]
MTISFQTMRPEKVPELIAKAHRIGAPWTVPMLRGAERGLVRLVMAGPGQSFPLSLLDMQKNPQPAIVVLGGDAFNAIGPEGFPRATRLLRWAGYSVLHGAGGEPWHYAMTVDAALLWRRVLLVECRGDHLQAWIDLKRQIAPSAPGLVFGVAEGKPAHLGEMRPPAAGTVFN